MIDLVGKRFIFLLVSLTVILPGLVAVLAGGLKPGIDFTGGYRLTVVPKSPDAYDADKFRAALNAVGYGDSLVKRGTIGEGSNITNTVTIDLPRISEMQEPKRTIERSNVIEALAKDNLVAAKAVSQTLEIAATTPVTATGTVTPGVTPSTVVLTPAAPVTGTGTITTGGTISGTGTVTATGTTTGTTGTTGQARPTETLTVWQIEPSAIIDENAIGPTVGRELVGRAFLAVAIASIAILIYLTLVFRKVPNAFRYGVCAVIALLHDVLVVVGIFAILGLLTGVEIDALFITAMLTVIGFSVHDTIVVFDRVRENIMRRRFERFEDVVNYSLVQTLARSINTSITVILTLFALYMFGGASIRNFVLALLIGIISGTYSSIFNASMLLVIWEKREWRGPWTREAAPPTTTTRRAAAR